MNIPYHTLLDFTKELIILLDAEGNIVHSNKVAQITLGLSEEALNARNIAHFLSDRNYYNVSEKILQASHNTMLDEIIFKKSDRKEFFSTVRICYPDPKSNFRALFITDLTYRYEFRKEISEKVRAIEMLSKSAVVRGGDMHQALNEVLKKSTYALDVGRVNVWLIDDDFTRIRCIGSCVKTGENIELDTIKGQELRQTDLPRYFEMLKSEEVIITDDVLDDHQTEELRKSYLVPNGIISMLDVPLRSDGKMIGVVCFEHTGNLRKWNIFEVKFGFLIAQVISLLIESYERTKLVKQQHRLILEKENLMEEISYRVKYSFGLVNALLNYHADKNDDGNDDEFFRDFKNQLQAFSGVHEILFEAKDYAHIDLNNFVYRINALVESIYQQKAVVTADFRMDKSIRLPISQALPVALIIDELLRNAYSRSFAGQHTGTIQMQLHIHQQVCTLNYMDDGAPLPDEIIGGNNDLCLALIDFFVKDLKGNLHIEVKNGNRFVITFPV